jgi:hypothetical protein
MAMKRNVTMSIAAGLLIAAAAVAQAEDMLVAGEFESQNVIVEGAGIAGAGGSGFESEWKTEVYPFPAHYGTAVD